MILEKKIRDRNFFWISIEGTDGAGKTTFSKKLYNYLGNRYKDKTFFLINEFSDCKVGNLIKRIVSKNNFFYLGNDIHYPIAETLVLSADLIYQFEKNIFNRAKKKRNIYVISDRGPYSFLVYQCLRLRSCYPGMKIDDWNSWIQNIFYPLRYPDISICLVSNIKNIKQRLIKRGDKVKNQDLKFIRKAQYEYIKIFKHEQSFFCRIIENSQGKMEKTLEDIAGIVNNSII